MAGKLENIQIRLGEKKNKASGSSEPTCLHELSLGLALFMGQSLWKEIKPHTLQKKKKKKKSLRSWPCTHPISALFCWNKATEQQWRWRMANIHSRYPERPHWGTPQSSAASHRKERLLTRNSRASGRGGVAGWAQRPLLNLLSPYTSPGCQGSRNFSA